MLGTFMGKLMLVLLITFYPTVSRAANLRELCPSRPGLGTAPCIVDQGHMLLEWGIADWTLEDSIEARSDTVLGGDILVRYGLSEFDELQLGWTAFGHIRERVKATGAVNKAQGTGDLTLTYKRSFRRPAGDQFSVAIQPFVSLPLDRNSAIGKGDWSAGILLPISVDLTRDIQFQASPEIDAAADEDRRGQHWNFGTVVGLGLATTDASSVTFELSAFRNEDPAGHFTEMLAGVSGTWQPSESTQLDLGVVAGLNHNSPDVELAFGISHRF